MANYNCTIRTNYFHVKDEAAFRNVIENTSADDNIEIFDDQYDSNGNKVFGFGCYGCIHGLYDPEYEDDDCDYNAFIEELAKCVVDDEAILIFESGHEKMRYVTGSCVVVTAKETKYLTIEQIAVAEAQRILEKPDYHTICTY